MKYPVVLALCGIVVTKAVSHRFFDDPLFNQSSILFDISEFAEGSGSLMSNLSVEDIQASPYFYYSEIVEGRIIAKTQYQSISDVSHIFASNKYDLMSVGLLQPNKSNWGNVSKYIEDAREMEVEAIIFHVNSTIPIKEDYMENNACFCKGVSEDLVLQFESFMATQNEYTTVIGIEITDQLFDCCGTKLFKVLDLIELVVLRTEFTPETTMLSQHLFTSRIKNDILNFQTFVRRANPDCVMVFRIKFNSKDILNENIRYTYLAYFNSFLEEWNSSVDEKLKIVMETYPKFVKPKAKNMRSNVIPSVLVPHVRHHKDNLESVCESHEILNSISSSFNNVVLDNLKIKSLLAIIDCCCEKYNIPDRSTKTNFYVLLKGLTGENLSLLYKLILSIPITTVFIPPYYPEGDPVLLYRLVQITKPHGVEIGCHPSYLFLEPFSQPIEDFNNAVIQKCGSMFNISSVILVGFSLSIDNFDKVPRLILNISEIVTQFNQKFMDKKLMMRTSFGTQQDKFYLPTVLPETSRLTVYCDPELWKQIEVYDAVLNFANVFDLGKIMMQPFVYEAFSDGWWSSVKTTPELNRSQTDFPLLVQRTVPPYLRQEMNLFNSFDCINWTSTAEDTGIKFSKTYFGITVNTNGITALNASLTKEEIRTLLLFSFGKFSIVEWTITPNMRLKTLSDAISKKFQNALVASGEKILYFELTSRSVTSTLLSQIRTLGVQFANTENFTFRVHFSGWENQYLSVFQQLKNSNINNYNKTIFFIGLTVDCVNEANNELKTLKNFTSIFPVHYIVCNMQSIVASNYNQDTMQKFLDTIFYIKTYITRLFVIKPPEVYFRINYAPFGCETKLSKVKDFLRFTNDINQHAEIYKIKYFMFPAFGNDLLNKTCPVSWWRLSNDSDLTNISVYTERESDYFGRPTLPGLTFIEQPAVDDALMDETNTLIYLLTLLFSGTLFVIAALSIKLYHMRKRYLTKAEVQAFRNGKVAADGEIIPLEEMKFLDQFEVEKHNVELCKVVGRGNFGVVYSGILNDEIPVAVKMPNSECSKQSFKSMLAEVKIMSHIGTHPNILSLVATYTKEIRKGQIYIITELCEKGSLQNYLRSKKNSDSTCLYELNKFAYQIALGMEYIAGKNIIHGDLSTRNVLLAEDGMCKIGDFGLSRKLYEYQKYIKKSKEPLPWRWMALESLQRMEFTTKSDVWSYGVTLWEIFSYGQIPYIGSVLSPEFVNDLEKGMRLPKLKNLSEDIFMKMNECWNILPENRPTFSGLAQFFTVLQNIQYDMI